MEQIDRTQYRNASYFLTLLGCILSLAGSLIRSNVEYRSMAFEWAQVAVTLVGPIFSFWIGGLFRVALPKPKVWVKAILCALMAGMYLRLSLWQVNSRLLGYDFLMLSLVIMGYLLLPVAESMKNRGWLMLVLSLASAFCYGGAFIVSSHYSFPNFSFRESEWTVLFIRMMKVVPLVMGLLFLMAFSLSEKVQNLASRKWFRYSTVIIVAVTGISWYFLLPWVLRHDPTVIVHPMTVYLAVVIIRAIKNIRLKGPWKNVFKI